MSYKKSSKQRGGRRSGRRSFLNIGTFLFMAVFVYLLIAFIMYLARGHVSPYELTEGVIVDDSVFSGVIIRNEEQVRSPKAGYLNYYLDDKSKSGKGEHVCAITSKRPGEDKEKKDNNVKDLPAAQESVVVSSIQNYVSTYSPDQYSDLYVLHDEINTSYGFTSADQLTSQLDQLSESGSEIEFVDAPDDGLIVYATDDLTGLTEKKLESDIFDQKDYKEQIIRPGTKVKKNDALFRVVTDEKWSIIVPLNRKSLEKLKKTKSVETRVGNMKNTIRADYKTVTIDGKEYGRLSYTTDMFRFASSRFVNVEMILQNDSGLKLPKSAVTEKQVYKIPGEFVITDPDTAQTGVQVVGTDQSRKFTKLNVFYSEENKDTGKKTYYIKPGQLEAGTVVGKDNSSDTYKIGPKKAFEGVYNINKGYAVFQHIDVIASNKQYYVIRDNTTYGPMTYDHIALNADKIKENQIVH